MVIIAMDRQANADDMHQRQVTAKEYHAIASFQLRTEMTGAVILKKKLCEDGNMTEDEHDQHVAPLLWQAAKEAEKYGGTVFCFAEYGDRLEDGQRDSSRTSTAQDPTAAAKVVDLAMKSKGNLDMFCMSVAKAHREGALDCSATIFAKKFDLI